MSKPAPLRKGNWVECTHYAGRKAYEVNSVNSKADEVWVNDHYNVHDTLWWGPRKWFKKLRSKPNE